MEHLDAGNVGSRPRRHDGLIDDRPGEGLWKLEGGEITEAEHVIVHELREASLANLKTPRLALTTSVPEPYRDSRGRLLHIAAAYAASTTAAYGSPTRRPGLPSGFRISATRWN